MPAPVPITGAPDRNITVMEAPNIAIIIMIRQGGGRWDNGRRHRHCYAQETDQGGRNHAAIDSRKHRFILHCRLTHSIFTDWPVNHRYRYSYATFVALFGQK
jgi:hypothetical protein